MHSKSVTDLSEPDSCLTSEHPDMMFKKGSKGISRKPSFLVRARETLLRGSNGHLDQEQPGEIPGLTSGQPEKRPRLSRKTSFLESRPIRTLSKLTRRASFSTNELSNQQSRVWSLNGGQTQQRRRAEAVSRQLPESIAASAGLTHSMTHLSQSGIPAGTYMPPRDDDLYPVDFLEGKMDLRVVLPSMTIVKMSVERRTPMIDLLVQVTTSNKITPGDHVLQVMNERSDDFLYYKPSTPIGALEASTVHIMPKHRVNDCIVRKVPMKMVNQPFETTFRLQVRLPRNQLYVARVTPRMPISQVLQQVCKDRNLDESKFEIRHPDNLDERLRPNYTLADYQLTEVSLVSVSKSNPNSRSVSTSDIFRFQQEAEILAREAVVAKKQLGRKSSKTRSSAGESSVSSGSLGDQGDRSLSPLVNSRSELHLNHVGRSGSSIMAEPPYRPKKKKAPPPPGKSRQLPTSPGDGELPLAALQRSGLIDSPTKSISMSNLTQSGINGDFPSASNLSTVSAGSVLSLNSTTSGRTKRRAPAPPKKLSPVPPVVPIPEETPSLIYKEEAVVEPKTKVQSPTPAPEPAPRTLGIVKQETVEETVEDVVPPPPAPQSPEADEYRTKALEAQESVEEIIEEASVEDPKTAVPQLQRQDRFEQSLESPMDGPSAEDIEKELAKREKEQRRKERRERREKRAKENEQALATTPQPQLDVIPSPASEEMKEVPVDSPVTSTPKPEKISTFSEAKVHESRVEADPSPKHVPIVEDAKVSEPEPKQPEPETTSSVEPVVVADTKPIVDEEPIEPTLRASTSTVDLASDKTGDGRILDNSSNPENALENTEATTRQSSTSKKMAHPSTDPIACSSPNEPEPLPSPKPTTPVDPLTPCSSNSSAHAISPEIEVLQGPTSKQESQHHPSPKDQQNAPASQSVSHTPDPVPLNPLVKAPKPKNPILNPRALGARPKEKSEPPPVMKQDSKTDLDNLPNFKFAPAAQVNVHGPGSQKDRPNKAQVIPVDEEGSKVDDDLLDGDVTLFSMQQPIFRPKPKPKAKKVDKVNPAAIKGLTPEEEIKLEEAKKAEEAKKIQEEQERVEKAKKLAEERESKRTELQKKMEKSRQLQIERDMRAHAKQDQSIETYKTEDLRHQLTSQIYDVDEPLGEPQYKRKVAPNTVTLEIDEDDDLLPIRRNRSGSTTSTSTSSTDAEGVEPESSVLTKQSSNDTRAGGSALSQYSQGLVSMSSTYRTGLETQEQVLDFDTESSTYTTIGETLKDGKSSVPKDLEQTFDSVSDQTEELVTQDEGQETSIVTSENSNDSLRSDLGKRQAISQALEESYASIDGKDLSTEDQSDSQQWEYKIPEVPAPPPSGFQDSESGDEQVLEDVKELPIQAKTIPVLQQSLNVQSQGSGDLRRKFLLEEIGESCTDTEVPNHSESVASTLAQDFDSDFESFEPKDSEEEGIQEAVNIVPVIRGPMQFSIDSYDSRDRKEMPYYQKLARSESMNTRHEPTDEDGESVTSDHPTKNEDHQKVEKYATLPPNMNVTPIVEESDCSSEDEIEATVAKETRVTTSEIFSNVHEPTTKIQGTDLVTSPAVPDSFREEIKQTQPILVQEVPKPVPLGVKPSIGEHPSFRSNKAHRDGKVPWIMKKSSFQSNRVVLNDDLVLNLRRKQSFGTSTPLPITNTKKERAVSMVNLDRIPNEPEPNNLKVAVSQESMPPPTSSIQSTLSAIKQEILSKQSTDPRSLSPSSTSSISSSSVGLVTNALEKLGRPVEQIQLAQRSASPSPSSTLSSRGSSSQPHPLSALNESSNSLDDSQSGHSSLQSGGSEGGTMSSRIQRFHGPPSIQLGTWDDRSRKMSEMAIPTFGSAKTARSGRHSLASLSNSSSELSSLKSSSPQMSHMEEDEADFNHMNQQVRASIQRMEQSHQNKPPKFDAKIRVAKPWKRASLSQMSMDLSEPKNEALVSARKPSAMLSPVGSPTESKKVSDKESPKESAAKEEKPRHFYFGQEPSATDNSLSKSKPTAIEKVKNNEALSHPQNIVVNPGYQLKEYVNPMEKSGKPNFAFGDTPPSKPAKSSHNSQISNGIPKPVLPPKTKDVKENEPPKEEAIEPKIKPAVVNYSKFADFRVPRPQLEPKPKRPSQPEKTQDEVRKAFEAELSAGKKKLKSYETNSDSGSNSVSPGPNVSIIPPPPPPQFSNGHHIPPAPKMNGSIVPQAPKLTNFPSNVTANGKRIVPAPSKQESSHADLLVAIRNKGGVKGLRKTGKHL